MKAAWIAVGLALTAWSCPGQSNPVAVADGWPGVIEVPERPGQVTVTLSARFIESPLEQVEKVLAVLEKTPSSSLSALAPDVKVLSAPRVSMRTNTLARIEVANEIIYPTAFQLALVTAGTRQKPGIVPGAFATRNSGVMLEATARLPDDGDRSWMWMELEAEVVELVDWIQYGRKVKGVQQNLPAPVFDERRLANRISLGTGEPVILGALSHDKAEQVPNDPPLLRHIPLLRDFFTPRFQTVIRRRCLIIQVQADLADGRAQEDKP